MLMHFYRVSEIPKKVEAGVCYVTKDDATGMSKMHFVNRVGDRVYTTEDVYGSGSINTVTVPDIKTRDLLVPSENTMVVVLNTGDDGTVSKDVYLYEVDSASYILLTDTNKTSTPFGEDPDW